MKEGECDSFACADLSGKQVFYCRNNCTTSLYVCTHFARYLDGIRCSWIIIERLSLTFTANGKNETFAVSLQLCVQWSEIICICNKK